MKHTLLIAAVLGVLSLSACDKPTVVNVPAPEAVPGPAGPAGATGEQGDQGNAGLKGNDGSAGEAGAQGLEGTKGETGQAGDGTTVIVVPPDVPAPAN